MSDAGGAPVRRVRAVSATVALLVFLFIVMLLLAAIPCLAETNIRVTAQILSPRTTTAMFGKLPKGVSAVGVGICNQTGQDLSGGNAIPLVRIAQQFAAVKSLTVLPHDAAMSVIAMAEGSSLKSKVARSGVAFVGIAGGLATSRAINLSAAWGSSLAGLAAGGQLILPYFIGAVSDHANLVYDHEQLPAMLNLPPLGCVSGIALVEATGRNVVEGSMDIVIALPEATP